MQATVCLLLAALLCCTQALQFVSDTPSPFTSADRDEPKYIVTLDKEVDEGALLDGPFVTMTDVSGRSFRCALPAAGSEREDTLLQANANEEPVRSPQDLLDSLEGMCLYRQDGLWTYEICYKKHVRQIHQGQNKEEHSCGVYQEEGGEEGGEEGAGAEPPIKVDRSTVGPAMPYISQSFVGGAACLLTKKPRTSEVRFACLEEGGQNVVTSVREFPTCNYVFIVSTPFLCKHPTFRPKEELVQAINCTLVPGQRVDTQVEGDLVSGGEAEHLRDGSNVFISTGDDDEELLNEGDDVHVEL